MRLARWSWTIPTSPRMVFRFLYRSAFVVAVLVWWLWEWVERAVLLGAAVAALAGLALVLPWTRPWTLRRLRARRVQRQWHRVAHALWSRRVTLRRLRPTPVGWSASVRVPTGKSWEDIAGAASALAAAVRAREVRVEPQACLSWANVRIIQRDGFRSSPWPARDAEQVDLWKPIPLGLDEEGMQVYATLTDQHFLVGGMTGSGKSRFLHMLIAGAALDPRAKLWILDQKLVEGMKWSRCAERFCGEVSEGEAVVAELCRWMDKRYQGMAARGQTKVTKGGDLCRHFVIIDELAAFAESKAFCAGLTKLVAKGRAAGVVVIAATQQPSCDLLATSIRNNFGYRWAGQTMAWQTSDMILGANMHSKGWDASNINYAPGRGILWVDAKPPRMIQSHLLSDSDLDRLIRRAETLRGVVPRPTLVRNDESAPTPGGMRALSGPRSARPTSRSAATLSAPGSPATG